MIKVILIDDEPLARMVVKEYLQAFPQLTVMTECSDGFEALKAISQYQPDLIFLDIQMPKINGFEMLELIEDPPAVIFTTAFDEYALKAFELLAIDYLLKPFSQERFNKGLQKWLDNFHANEQKNKLETLLETAAQQPNQQQRVVVKIGNKIKIIPMEEIQFLEADDDYVKIHTEESCFLKKKTMSYFEQILDASQFVRVHRSYILQISEITKIEPYEKDSHIAILKSGKRIPISKTGYPKLKAILEI